MKKILSIILTVIILSNCLLVSHADFNDAIELYEAWDTNLKQYTLEVCEEHNIPYYVAVSVIYHESRYSHDIGTKYVGLMQISTSKDVINFLKRNGVLTDANQLYDPRTNILAGITILKYGKSKTDTLEDMVYMYTMGEGNCAKRKAAGLPYNKATIETVAICDIYKEYFLSLNLTEYVFGKNSRKLPSKTEFNTMLHTQQKSEHRST